MNKINENTSNEGGGGGTWGGGGTTGFATKIKQNISTYMPSVQ